MILTMRTKDGKEIIVSSINGVLRFYDFEHQVRYIDENADFLHIDIKDGNYVKTFGVGPGFMTVLKKTVISPMDAHLMVKHPQNFLEACAEAGAGHTLRLIQTVLRAMHL